MSGKMEHLTPEGYRIDGRRKEEPRSIVAKLGGVEAADGSASLAWATLELSLMFMVRFITKTAVGIKTARQSRANIAQRLLVL